MEEASQDPVQRRQRLEEYWASFLRTFGPGVTVPPDRYQAWSFGNTPEMADDLGGLVRQGLKTATACLVWSIEAENEPFPEVGDYSIILDGRARPLCIIQTTRTYVLPFDEVDAEQAFLEGEGDRSLAYWRKVHWEFFGAECRQIGREPTGKMPVLCERFVLAHK